MCLVPSCDDQAFGVTANVPVNCHDFATSHASRVSASASPFKKGKTISAQKGNSVAVFSVTALSQTGSRRSKRKEKDAACGSTTGHAAKP